MSVIHQLTLIAYSNCDNSMSKIIKPLAIELRNLLSHSDEPGLPGEHHADITDPAAVAP